MILRVALFKKTTKGRRSAGSCLDAPKYFWRHSSMICPAAMHARASWLRSAIIGSDFASRTSRAPSPKMPRSLQHRIAERLFLFQRFALVFPTLLAQSGHPSCTAHVRFWVKRTSKCDLRHSRQVRDTAPSLGLLAPWFGSRRTTRLSADKGHSQIFPN